MGRDETHPPLLQDMTTQTDPHLQHAPAIAAKIITFVSRRRRPRVRVAIRAEFNLEKVPFADFLKPATNNSARAMTEEASDV